MTGSADSRSLARWAGTAFAKHAALFALVVIVLSLAHAIWPDREVLGGAGIVNGEYLALAPVYWLLGLVPFALFCLTPLAALKRPAARWFACVGLPPALFPALVTYETPATLLGLVVVDIATLALTSQRRSRQQG